MGEELHPTPTRRRVLRRVDAGEVWQSSNHETWDMDHFKLTSRVAELERAGWIERDEQPSSIGDLGFDGRLWRLTDAGRAVLDGAS